MIRFGNTRVRRLEIVEREFEPREARLILDESVDGGTVEQDGRIIFDGVQIMSQKRAGRVEVHL